MRNILIAGLFVVVASVATGCDQPQAQERPKWANYLDNAYANISAGAAFIQTQAKLNMEQYCSLAKVTTSLKNQHQPIFKDESLNKVSRNIMDNIANTDRSLCQINKLATTASASVAKSAKFHKKLPKPLFSFSVIILDEDKAQEEKLGLFYTLQDCLAAESVARTAGIATRACREWTPIINP